MDGPRGSRDPHGPWQAPLASGPFGVPRGRLFWIPWALIVTCGKPLLPLWKPDSAPPVAVWLCMALGALSTSRALWGVLLAQGKRAIPHSRPSQHPRAPSRRTYLMPLCPVTPPLTALSPTFPPLMAPSLAAQPCAPARARRPWGAWRELETQLRTSLVHPGHTEGTPGAQARPALARGAAPQPGLGPGPGPATPEE